MTAQLIVSYLIIIATILMGIYFLYDPTLSPRMQRHKDERGKDVLIELEAARKVPYAAIAGAILLSTDVIAMVLLAMRSQ